MNTSTPNCMLTSAGLHAAALAFLLFAPALSSRPPVTSDSPVMEMQVVPSDLKVTDGNTVGGGSPDAKPPVTPQQQQQRSVSPPVEVPKPEPEKPAKEPDPPKINKPAEPPKTELAKQTKVNQAPPVVRNTKNAQDVDPALAGKPEPKKPIQLAEATKRRTKDEASTDKAAADARLKADKERQERAAAARAAWDKARQERADALRGAASALGTTLGGSTSIQMPGPGGQAYAPYGVYLAAFYKLRWKKPSTLSVDRAEVGAEITVLRDGTVKSFQITSPSGIKALDDSVRAVLDKNRELKPLPEGTTDTERTITIRFDLSATSST